MEKIRAEIKAKAAKMNIKVIGLEEVPWIVQGRPLFDFEGVDFMTLKQLNQNTEDLFAASGLMNVAIFSDGRVEGLKTVSSQYNLLQHLNAINLSMDFIPPEFQLEKIDIKTSPTGGRMWATMESALSEEIIPGDKIKFQATMQNSADTSKVLRFVAGAYRLVCSNGMVSPDNRFESLSVNKLHKSGLDFKKDCQGFFENVDKSFASVSEWKKYAAMGLTQPAMEDVFKKLSAGPRVQEEILSLEMRGQETTPRILLAENKLTAWDLYNAFTQRITDSESLESVKIENGTHLSRVFDKIMAVA